MVSKPAGAQMTGSEDANRYRWIRANFAGSLLARMLTTDELMRWQVDPAPDDVCLDAAIDAAIAKEQT